LVYRIGGLRTITAGMISGVSEYQYYEFLAIDPR